MKRCGTCRKMLPKTDFWRDGSRWDGTNRECKECGKARDKTRRRRITHWNAVKRDMERNPKKIVARAVIKKLIKTGELTKQPCFLCDATPAVAHHLNYDFPDKVIWVCPPHHSLIHHA